MRNKLAAFFFQKKKVYICTCIRECACIQVCIHMHVYVYTLFTYIRYEKGRIMDGKEGLVSNSQLNHRKISSKKNANDNDENCTIEGRRSSNREGKEKESYDSSEQQNGIDVEKITVSTRSIILFQILLFFVFFFVLLIGSFNFSFKLFQVREKHLYELLNNIKDLTSCRLDDIYAEVREGDNTFFYKSQDKLINTNNDIFEENVNFKYYFTRGKHYKKTKKKMKKNNGDIKIFICLNKKKKSFYFNNFYDIFSRCKKCIFKIFIFFFNEIRNAFFLKEFDDSTDPESNHLLNDDYVKHNAEVISKYIYFNKHLDISNSYKKYYVNMEYLFYFYLNNICYYHDFAYFGGSVQGEHNIHILNEEKTEESFPLDERAYGKITSSLYSRDKRDIIMVIKHISKYLNDEMLLNLFHKLYFDICIDGNVLSNLSKSGEESNEKEINKINNEHILKNIKTYEKYYNVYHKMENMKNVNRFNDFLNILRKKIRTVTILKGLNKCLTDYIKNLKKIPFYFFLDDFFDTPCYVYNKLISNILRYYYKGIFLYFIIFIGCIHVFFSPFPITLVHFRRFFIYFLIIMYRLFILYFIPSIIQYIIYKFHYFKDEEYMHIFDYSDHVILFSTLLFITSLEAKAIEYTIKYQKVSSDYFHFKYNRRLCIFLLKLVLYYYYILIFFFLYTSYFTSKYFHTTNEIFVAYFFSTFSIFFIFYFFLYKNYFSFYSIGITSYMQKNILHAPSHTFHASPYTYNTYISMRDKFPLD
ncbi:hypothetical protein, conserved [Plasmodium gonderi]|uniref:Uncharacterized protein n=1 Tax=Plasmodium gonderi TaxID=77519 RepID=A0A1Y1JEF6_PLAGO|nr:hypothetical protein, conserved [Plasmodium gonderi]GAW80909.1 hypothetical protein, conserved [Plasmodium gonderi]